ncbi:MAG: pyridoxine 5'-phosphate synthase [candidate division Zixibacteria bacterium]|nr:pyridoxine 5'-phosphate synthase [candidate division Zixibacteria bacterium]
MAFLSINLDGIGAFRDSRKLKEPDPSHAAVLAELAGADGIAVQFRPDRRYIRDRDLYILREMVRTKLTVEMSVQDEMMIRIIEVKPWMVIFNEEPSAEDSVVQPINLQQTKIDYQAAITQLRGHGIVVGLLIDPNADSIKASLKVQADAVFLDCSRYSDARTVTEAQEELDKIDNTAQFAVKSRLTVLAGRGLSYKNISPLVETGMIDEFLVGSAVTSRALLVGFERAAAEMVQLVRVAPRRT